MAKKRSRIADYLVYLIIRFVIAILQALSYNLACRLAEGLAWLAWKLDKRHRLVALENVTQAFGDNLSLMQRERLVRDVYRHFCRIIIEMVHLGRRLHPCNWRSTLELTDGRVLVDVMLSGRPLLLVTGHFGNWELAGYILGLLGFHTYAIARPIDNPFLDAYLRTFRERTGQRILTKNDDFDQIQHVLAKGRVLATLGDQDAGQRGVFVPFFGRPASTHKAIALLALEYDVSLLVAGTPRVGEPMRYQVQIEDVIHPADHRADRDGGLVGITRRFTAALERLITRHPEQYFWLHRRWKHQPVRKKVRMVA
jgi:Kdo2-lipid IVA lauroyltransferase/acyltransferase